MEEHNHLVIMAGGVGSRFWPMSTPEKPKQFVDVMGCGRSLIQLTFDRFKPIISAKNMWVVTSAKYLNIVREQLPEIPWNHVLLEPCRRNTAPCIAYASWRIKAQDPKANVVVAPSDAIVMDVVEFQRVVNSCLKFVAESDAKEQDAINEVFPQCENISIDYAIMEKAEEIYVFPASFGWSDLGTWGSLHENSERDIYGNALIGENIDVYETTNCIVHATQEKRVVVQGLDGFIVAECDDTLLICRLSDEQRIKQFSESKE